MNASWMTMWQVQDQSLSVNKESGISSLFYLAGRFVALWRNRKKGESKDETGRKQEKNTATHTSGWPSGPRLCVQVSPWRRGVASTSDRFLLGLAVGRIPLRVQGARTCPEHGKVPLREVDPILKAACLLWHRSLRVAHPVVPCVWSFYRGSVDSPISWMNHLAIDQSISVLLREVTKLWPQSKDKTGAFKAQ